MTTVLIWNQLVDDEMDQGQLLKVKGEDSEQALAPTASSSDQESAMDWRFVDMFLTS